MLESFFSGVKSHQTAIFIVVGVFFGLLFSIQWMCWLFGRGRYKAKNDDNGAINSRGPLRHVIADLFVKVIDDFRHLLALLIVVVFACSLFYSLVTYGSGVDNLSKALQAVTGSLGGIIGVILGYYFGESAARGADRPPPGAGTVGDPRQGEPGPTASSMPVSDRKPVEAAPRPASD